MKISYFPKQIALNSDHVIGAFLRGCIKNGITPVENTFDADMAVIWSVLWSGRMSQNLEVFQHFRKKGKPVFIIEVGSLKRRISWKVSVNHIDASGVFPINALDLDRPKKLELALRPQHDQKDLPILIAGQHQSSLLWEKMPTMVNWVNQTIKNVRKYTDREIFVRPHPRFPITIDNTIAKIQSPQKINGTYDNFDLNFNYHCLINHNSGPSVQSAINGTPIICDKSSLAYEVSMPLEKINEPFIPNREEWFIKICHTEWTVEEIETGYPINQLLQQIFDK